eukprot:scaffold3341_cov171-Amphora_coffeaeformis.AAC.8
MKRNKQPRNLADEAADYARRLCHQCLKALRKEVKTVRNLTCQKLARQIKQGSANNAKPDQEGTATANYNDNNKAIKRLERFKQLSIDAVVEETARRLGLPQLEQKAGATAGTTTETTKAPPLSTTPSVTAQSEESLSWQEGLVEKLLQHKKMQLAIETWSAQLTEYRQWCVRQEERQQQYETAQPAAASATTKSAKKKKKKKQAQLLQQAADEQDKDFSQSVFLTLGDEGGDSDNDDNGDKDARTKKNRPGQRARQAKTMALQAKKEGRKLDASLNWRTKKPAQPTAAKEQPPPPAAVVEPPEELHPSWAARKVQKTGISEFQGKKITFD